MARGHGWPRAVMCMDARMARGPWMVRSSPCRRGEDRRVVFDLSPGPAAHPCAFAPRGGELPQRLIHFVRRPQPGVQRALNPAGPGRGVLAGEVNPAFRRGDILEQIELADLRDDVGAARIGFVQP